ncbi:MAG: hypothetical protein LBS36_01825 [Oscillospiraceae bacterium]|jgi:hypothetical protein|nr:hypothetical protein [Oscillospiraceae bacterium]
MRLFETKQETDFLKDYSIYPAENKQKDYDVIFGIMSLRNSFTNKTLADFYSPHIETCLIFELQDFRRITYKELEYARNLEKENTGKAIEIYEKYVSFEWSSTTIPYDRLAIIYRKQKNYDEEIRVLKAAIFAFRHHKRSFGAGSFVDRLEKTLVLKIKNMK